MKHQKKYGKRSVIGIAMNGRKERPVRTQRTLAAKGLERRAASPLPREMSAKILGNPWNKLTAKNRKRVMRSRDFTVVNPAITLAKPAQDRLDAKILGMTMGQLVRLTVQCPHRIQTAKSILEDLSPDSRFAHGIRHTIAVNVFVLAAVEVEIKRRSEAPAVRDTRTPRIRKQDAIKAALTHSQGR